MDLRQQLQDIFGLDDFRPAQREVIERVLRGGDVLCVMPTGAGKSLCYQLPAAVQGGLTIVVSPLISLMEDQVQQLRDEQVPAALLNSSLSAGQQRMVIEEVLGGFEGLLYVAPERFFSPAFEPVMNQLHVKLLAVDEAHCISMWGHDFRPEYQRLGEVRKRLGMPATIALTATATEDVRRDIIQGLGLREPHVVVTGFDRPNLSYQSRRISKGREKDSQLLQLLREESGSAIVYCGTRKTVDELSGMLAEQFRQRAIAAYHAGMDQAARTASQERFMQSAGAIAVATNAFGMGINKPDIRLVVHYNLPGTLEAYYQEAGRAGRDGLPSRCVLMFNYQDRVLQEFFIDKIGEQREQTDQSPPRDEKLIEQLKRRATEKLELMMRYGQTHRCRRRLILEYFGDVSEVENCTCDVCDREGRGGGAMAVGAAVPEAVVTLVRQILSAVARLNGKFGVGGIAEVLTGTRSERTERWGLDQLTVFGLLGRYPTKRVIAMVHRVIESGLARQKDVGSAGKPIYVVELTVAGVAVMKGAQPPPLSLADLAPIGSSARPAADRARAAQAPLPPADEPLDNAAQARFERLRATRLELARERDLPPYCICHDSTLKLIARDAPADLEALERLKGMGPNKVKMYGQRLLAALRDSAG